MKYLNIAIICFLFQYFTIHAQNAELINNESDTIDKIYFFAEKMPEFPGGNKELLKYIQKNFRYPTNYGALSGNVYVRFVVDENGKILNPSSAKGSHPSLNNESLRLIKEMPDWLPGEHNGKKVKVWYVVLTTYWE